VVSFVSEHGFKFNVLFTVHRGKSSSNHHLAQYFLFFPSSFKRSKYKGNRYFTETGELVRPSVENHPGIFLEKIAGKFRAAKVSIESILLKIFLSEMVGFLDYFEVFHGE